MTEGKTYSCTRERTPNGYRVWVARRRTLSAEGSTFAEADRRLWEAIGLETGDAESIRQYSPPEPLESSGTSGVLATLRELGAIAGCRMTNPADLFEGGYCSNCMSPIGGRSDRGMRVDAIESGVQSAYARLPRCPIGNGPSITLVTDAFLSLLEEHERALFEWRPVESSRRGKRNFYEMIPLLPPVPDVGIKSRKAYYGKCETCGATWVVSDYAKGAPNVFVSVKDLPHPTPDVLAVGERGSARLTMSEARWAELAGKPGVKGMDTSVTAIVDESLVEREPVHTPRPPAIRPSPS